MKWKKRRRVAVIFGYAPESPVQLAPSRHYCSRCWLQKQVDWLCQPLPASVRHDWLNGFWMVCLKWNHFSWEIAGIKQKKGKIESRREKSSSELLSFILTSCVISPQVKTVGLMNCQQTAKLSMATSSTTWERVWIWTRRAATSRLAWKIV